MTVGRWLIAAAILGVLVGPAEAQSGKHAAEAAPVAHDGPFGIAMGEPLSQLGPVEKNEAGYRVKSPPRPSDQIYQVDVEAYPSTGVCSILATTRPNENDPNAVNAKMDADGLASALQSKYGAPIKVDKCEAAIGAECAHFLTQAISAGSANYAYLWKFASPRPDHIQAIAIGVSALSDISTSVMVDYLSDSSDACQAAKNASAASAF
jgi:hypothetical protein